MYVLLLRGLIMCVVKRWRFQQTRARTSSLSTLLLSAGRQACRCVETREKSTGQL